MYTTLGDIGVFSVTGSPSTGASERHSDQGCLKSSSTSSSFFPFVSGRKTAKNARPRTEMPAKSQYVPRGRENNYCRVTNLNNVGYKLRKVTDDNYTGINGIHKVVGILYNTSRSLKHLF